MKFVFQRAASLLLSVLLILSVITALSACGSDETVYKSGLITEIEGQARVRRGEGTLPAYKDLSLRNGDILYTDVDTTVCIALDTDKYLLVEPSSIVSFKLYKNEAENVTAVFLTKGAVYVEADTPPSSPDLNFGVYTAEGTALGGEAAYRVERIETRPKGTLVQAMAGVVAVSHADDGKWTEVYAGKECKIDRAPDGEKKTFYSYTNAATDPYLLPDNYIALGAEGIFDAAGNRLARPASGDISLRGITLTDGNGEVSLSPMFDNSVFGYVAVTADPKTLTVTANHPRTRISLECHTAASVVTEGNCGTVSFDGGGFHAVSILVVAENGAEARFSVNIVPSDG